MATNNRAPRTTGEYRSNRFRAGAMAAIATFSLAANGIEFKAVGTEQRVGVTAATNCAESQLLDSPARAIRRADGSIVVYATHFNNWYLKGADWNNLQPACASAFRGAENPDYDEVDDRQWIQALATEDGINVVALASHEYLGARHGRCATPATREMPFPCWYSSITQLVSHDGALTFARPERQRIVATPQIPFDESRASRTGFLTTSNIVKDGAWRYVLISIDGYGGQKSGTCIFRAEKSSQPVHWLGWDGEDFRTDLSKVARSNSLTDSVSACAPLPLGSINRSLVKDRSSELWIAVGTYRQRNVENSRPGIYFSTSKDLLRWSAPRLLIETRIDFEAPACPPVYKYPSIIDHDSPDFDFGSIGKQPYLYLTKVLFNKCKYAGRELVRIPLAISE